MKINIEIIKMLSVKKLMIIKIPPQIPGIKINLLVNFSRLIFFKK